MPNSFKLRQIDFNQVTARFYQFDQQNILGMYQIDVNNPTYYRSHPYKNQLDLPTSAFKNREIQQFYSEIPQGKEYFEQTNKKHFSNMFNRSEIQKDNVLNEDYPQQEIERSRIAMDRSYFRSLNVEDIEGAKPNTLISKAVKNREKAMTMMKKQESNSREKATLNSAAYSKPINNQAFENGYHLPSGGQKLSKHQEAMSKYSKNKSILENNSLRILGNYSNHYEKPNYTIEKNMSHLSGGQTKNQDPSHTQNNYHFRNHLQNPSISNSQFQASSHNQLKASALEKELMEKKRRIQELEKQLSMDHGQQKKINNQFHPVNPYKLQVREPQQSSQLTKQKSVSVPVQHYRRQHAEVNKTENYPSNSTPFNPQSNFQAQQKHLKYDSPLLNVMVPSKHNFQSTFKAEKNKSVEESSVPYYQPEINERIQSRINENINKGEGMEIDKRNIRKYNPTYLSFESDTIKGSIGRAGQNILL